MLQEVFAAAFNAILADEREINVRPWLYRIARNRSLNHLRRATAVGVDSMDVHLSEGGLTTADKVHKREEFRLLIADVQDLPETQRTALLLREIDALSYEQIAEAMETTVPSVKSLLVRARVSLAEAAQARLLSCDEVRVELGAVAEGLARTTAPVRRHLRTCDRCAHFRKQLRANNRAMAALYPVGPLFLLKKTILAQLGTTASAASGGTAAAGAGGARRRGRRAAGGHEHAGHQGRRRARRRRDRHRGRRRGQARRRQGPQQGRRDHGRRRRAAGAAGRGRREHAGARSPSRSAPQPVAEAGDDERAQAGCGREGRRRRAATQEGGRQAGPGRRGRRQGAEHRAARRRHEHAADRDHRLRRARLRLARPGHRAAARSDHAAGRHAAAAGADRAPDARADPGADDRADAGAHARADRHAEPHPRAGRRRPHRRRRRPPPAAARRAP